MKYYLSIFCLITLNLLFQPVTTIAATYKCTVNLTKEALGSGLEVQDWHDMYAAYKKYGACDDGALAEEFSDRVVNLLTNHWDKFGELNRLVIQHKSFEDFMIRHLDDLMSPAQFKKIVDNASYNCPTYGKVLCTVILQKTGFIGSDSID